MGGCWGAGREGEGGVYGAVECESCGGEEVVVAWGAGEEEDGGVGEVFLRRRAVDCGERNGEGE